MTTRARRAAVLAVDGGDSKTDVALVSRHGEVLGAVRRAQSSHAGLGRNGSTDALDAAIRAASRRAGLETADAPVADVGVFCLAGADLPVDDRRIARTLHARAWAETAIVRNDTFAVLRAGTERGWGVAVVCGAGLNCTGVGPDGRVVRFPALGEISGDWASGGGWIGRAALGAAVRARDGRGPRTTLERLVPDHFGLTRPVAVTEAVYLGRLDEDRLVELPPLVFQAAAGGDAVARAILDRLADEIVVLVTASLRRLRAVSLDADVVLGGGVFRARDVPFVERIRSGVQAVAARAEIRRLETPPVVGAALIALDRLGAPKAAAARVRESLTDARMGTRIPVIRPARG